MFIKHTFIILQKSLHIFLPFLLFLVHTFGQGTGLQNILPKEMLPDYKQSSNLITNNPFIQKDLYSLNKQTPPSIPKSPNNKTQVLQKYLEFKSLAIINKKKYFSINNKRINKSFWIPENETVNNIKVINYDPRNKTITITDGINTEIMPIISANETPLSVSDKSGSPVNQRNAQPSIPGAKAEKQNSEAPKTPTRRRVIPVKR